MNGDTPIRKLLEVLARRALVDDELPRSQRLPNQSRRRLALACIQAWELQIYLKRLSYLCPQPGLVRLSAAMLRTSNSTIKLPNRLWFLRIDSLGRCSAQVRHKLGLTNSTRQWVLPQVVELRNQGAILRRVSQADFIAVDVHAWDMRSGRPTRCSNSSFLSQMTSLAFLLTRLYRSTLSLLSALSRIWEPMSTAPETSAPSSLVLSASNF